ncbi:GNAT family N-acetyltransferase [Saccharopolyspora rosea]|uniref:GNAT family N-acetyltransferase n=1 Tax=Saccharopolyspora rosea TaxID=524884 RepID=A0ABW3FVF2_9PSEU
MASAAWQVEPAVLDDPAVVRLLWDYTAEMASRYHGRPASDAEVAAALAEDPHDGLAPPTGVFLLARYRTEPAGCVGLRLLSPDVAEIKRMYVRPELRGRGGGGRLLAACEQHGRSLGAAALRLDTRGDLVEARNLYAKHGFAEIPAYNDGRYAEHWFEKRLTTG